MSNNKRENHKEYLYGEDAIIVEEVPIILSVAPNGIYCTTVATTNNTNPTNNNTDNYLPGMILPNTTSNILDSHGSLMVTPYLMNQNQQNMILANTNTGIYIHTFAWCIFVDKEIIYLLVYRICFPSVCFFTTRNSLII